MNKNLTYSIIIVVLLGLGLWWFISRTSPQDALSPTPTVSVTASVTPTPTVSKVPVVPKITITSPTANMLVDSPITVTGKANVFENQFTVQMKDRTGRVVYKRDAVMSDAKDMGLFGNYSVKIPAPVGLGADFKIEVLSYSAKGDGSFEGYASVPVKLKTTDTGNVYAAFFAGAGSTDCSTITLYPRTIIKSPQYVYMSLVELLKGVSPEEVGQGATTQIPAGAQINSFQQTGDTVRVDFNQTLQQGVAGSCKVQAIRSQITNTLKQFLGINNVVISINGKTEGILQP